MGAKRRSSSIVASVRFPPFGSSSSPRTLPTDTPATRTSASIASWVASGNATLMRYFWAWSGIAPPNDRHRNSSSPKHDSANPTITSSRPKVGACFCIRASRRAERGIAEDGGQVQAGAEEGVLGGDVLQRLAPPADQQRPVPS